MKKWFHRESDVKYTQKVGHIVSGIKFVEPTQQQQVPRHLLQLRDKKALFILEEDPTDMIMDEIQRHNVLELEALFDDEDKDDKDDDEVDF